MDATADPTPDPTPPPAAATGLPEDERSAERADELLPEERAAGSDDPEAQAAAVLADSDERQDRRSSASE